MKHTHSDSAPIAAAILKITILDAGGRDAAGLDAARSDDGSLSQENLGAKERSRGSLGAIFAQSIPVPSSSTFSFFTAGGTS
ncbi:MAG: hypothetical protein ACLQDA_05725, partial [Terracidiphilus sp.]